MILVGIAGAAGAGKTTFARLLCGYFTRFRRIGFADALKKMALDMGWDGQKGDKGRKLLQLLGTDVCRQCIDNNYWVNRLAARVKTLDDLQLVVIDDVRFENEYDYVTTHFGYTVKIIGRASKKVNMDHASELGLPDHCFDLLLDNSGSMKNLIDHADALAPELVRRSKESFI